MAFLVLPPQYGYHPTPHQKNPVGPVFDDIFWSVSFLSSLFHKMHPFLSEINKRDDPVTPFRS